MLKHKLKHPKQSHLSLQLTGFLYFYSCIAEHVASWIHHETFSTDLAKMILSSSPFFVWTDKLAANSNPYAKLSYAKLS